MWPSLSYRNSNPPLITRQHYDTLEAKLKKKIINSAQKKKLKVLILILMSLNDFTMIAIINILVKQQTVTLFQWWCIISYQMMLTTLHKSSNSVATQRTVTWKPSVITIILTHHWQLAISQRLVTCRHRNVHTSITIISSFSFFIYIDISAVLFGGKKQTLAVRGLPFLHLSLNY